LSADAHPVQGEWEVLITDHHRGFIDWDTYQANQARIGNNIRPRDRAAENPDAAGEAGHPRPRR
jgi:hypothetical protein